MISTKPQNQLAQSNLLLPRRPMKPHQVTRKPIMSLTQIQATQLFRKYNPNPHHLTIKLTSPLRLREPLKILSTVSHKRIQSLALDSRYCQGFDDTDMLLLGKVLTKKFPHLRKLTCEVSLWRRITAGREGYRQLAYAFGNLKSLTELCINLELKNQSQQSLRDLAQNIKKLKDLKKIILGLSGGNSINDSVISTLANSIQHHASLTEFGLVIADSQSLKHSGINSLASRLTNLGQLKKLKLNFTHTYLSQHNQNDIIAIFKQLNQLTSLRLSFRSNSSVMSSSWRAVFQSIARLENLTRLNLDVGGYLPMLNLNEIAPTLSELTQLSSLRLNFFGNSSLSSDVWQKLAHSISKLTQLTELNLNLGSGMASFTLIDDEAINQLAQIIRGFKLTSLTLGLSHLDNMSNRNLIALASAIKKMPQLTSCNINLAWCCNIEKTGIAALIASIGGLESLTQLSLCFNGDSITDKHLEQLALLLAQHSRLSKLDLRLVGCKQVSDEGIGWLAHGLAKFPHLTELTLGLPSHSRVTEQSTGKLHTIIQAKKFIKDVVFR
jgi:hypothetical protein